MKITKELEAEIIAMMDDYWGAYFRGDLEHWQSYLVDDYRNIGGTEEEIWNSKQEIVEYTHRVIDQMVGMIEMRNKQAQIIPYDGYLMVHEFMEFFIRIDEKWTFYGKFRISTLIQKIDGAWKVLHQHGSYPDSHTEEGEAFAFDTLRKENTQLREAVKRRTVELENKSRELEIEASIERVRAVAMGMTKPEDMLKVCRVISDQLQQFGVENIRNVQTVIINEEKGTYHNYQYFTPYDTESVELSKCDETPVVHAMINRMLESADAFFTTNLTGEELATFRSYRKQENQFPDPLLDETESIVGHFFSIGPGGLGITLYRPLNEKGLEIFKRFHNVFSLAYRRFRDIEKAEAQAWEAEIELALERVRARTMAMQNSDELAEVSFLLFQQMEELGITTYSSGFTIWDEKNDELISWMCNADGSMNPPFQMPMTEEPWHREQYESWKKGEDFIVKDLAGEDWKAYLRYLRSFPLLDKAFATSEAAGHPMPVRQVHHAANFSHGNLLFITLEPRPEAHELFKRFARIFEQTYTRFLDLQKAEIQTREAQIEVAVERVRAKALAMHKSEEILQVAITLKEQMEGLHLDGVTAATIYLQQNDDKIRVWDITALKESEQGPQLSADFTFRLEDTDPDLWVRRVWNAKEKYSVIEMRDHDFSLCEQWIRGFDEKAADSYVQFIEATQLKHSWHPTIQLEKGKLSIDFILPPPSEIEFILPKMGAAFDLAYRRFLDLQKAEAQAREAQIEAALEKVRSRSLAMHNSDELTEVVSVLFEKLKDLQIPFTAVGIATGIEGSKDLNGFVCGQNDEGLVITNYRVPYFNNPVPKDLYNALEKQLDYFVGHYSKEEKDAFYEYVIEHTAEFRHLPEDIKRMIFDSPTYTISMVAVKNAVFNVNDFEGKVLADDEIDIIKRFARVFNQAYTRFLDLQKAEAQTREAQIGLAVERVRAKALAMFKSEEILDVVYKLKEEIMGLDIPGVSAATIHLKEPDGRYRAWDLTSVAEDENKLEISLDISYNMEDTHPDFFMREVWARTEDYFVVIQDGDRTPHTVQWLQQNGYSQEAKEFEEFLESSQLERAYHPTVPLNNGRMCIDLLEAPEPEVESILKKMAGAFDLAYKRFEDLQKAEAQAREAQIEAALERVRSRSLAMHHSSELSAVVDTLLQEFTQLEFTLTFCIINLIDEENLSNTVWAANPETGKDAESYYMKFEDYPFHHAMWKAWKEKDKRFVYTLEGEEKKIYDEYLYKDTEFRRFPKNVQEANKALDRYVAGFTFFKYSGLQTVSVNEITEAELEILERFGRVFEQAYTRFLDLQKAEAQAREAQIEAALERVRSASMAMHKTDELGQVVDVLFRQFSELKLDFYQVWINIFLLKEGISNCWFSPVEGVISKPYTAIIPLGPFEESSIKSWRAGEEFSYLSWRGLEEVNKIAKSLTEMTGHPSFQRIQDLKQMDRMEIVDCNHKYGVVALAKNDDITQSDLSILKRFTKVFEQTYTRFLDLQKAETQAREAKIETALEKVRSRTMGMQSSDELPEVANLLFLEVQALGIPAWSCGYCILLEDRKSSTCIMSSEGTLQKPFMLPHYGEVSFEEWDEFVHSEETFFTQELEGEAIVSHYDFMKSLPQLKFTFKMLEDAGLSLPTYQINHLCKFYHGFLLFITYEPVPDAHDIFLRFTKVFDQTYTRFLDLQKAEAQALEAQVELSLERIRAQVTGMQESSDLLDIVVTMRTEFIKLGHEAHYFWHMRWLPEHYKKAMTSGDGTRIGMVMTLPRHIHGDIKPVAEWEKSNEPTYILAMDVDEAVDYVDKMITLGDFEQVDPHAPTQDDIRHIGGLTFVMARTTHGEIGFSLPGVVPNPPKDTVDTLVRFAGVFDLAYKRFEDLKAAERQALLIREERDRLEIALNELHATQDQLVQQEKLASLGQLTAGIAHEIKNPLNFVNNFSDVSLEMIDEALEELQQIGENEHAAETALILADIKSNLAKIHEHGSRADSIVKSMLQHSRGGNGKMEPTPLNPIIKEYVNLAFHGMRASKEPINVDIDLQLGESVGEVPLIAEDFSRVILNLCNNAFDAMRDKQGSGHKAQGAGGPGTSIESPFEGGAGAVAEVGDVSSLKYDPKLTIRTKSSVNTVTIEIEDNGPGIPDEIKDKILQPFFTTKKGTQGTGLGLSITNDIVKAHGGIMSVFSEPGKTIFLIELKG